MKKTKRREPGLRTLYWGFTLCVFLVLVITISFFTGTEIVLQLTGLLGGDEDSAWRVLPVIISAVSSLALGSLVSFLIVHVPLKPIKKLVKAMSRLADGHFDERLDFGNVRPMKELADTFNQLAHELENTRILRSDFVNTFSHEFKTPIVSLRGFARLLQREDLSEAQRREYVDIIADESNRLANMATNVLNLTRLENQTILSNVHEFNLSEQLRRCLLLLEKKWTEKNLIINADFTETLIQADEELLKEVWVNLFDNAVKFSPEGGELTVEVLRKEGFVSVSFTNHGPEILPDQQRYLFDKFWQGDSSRATEGTGVGLSLVKRIVELHHGSIDVSSSPAETCFTVTLPLQ